MKKIILALLIAFNFTAFGQQTLFTDKKYEETLALAKAENKPIVLMFYATWCPHCNTMKKETFTDQAVIDFYTKNFVCMAVDSESESGKNLKNKFKDRFKVVSLPTFAFLDTNEKLLYCTSGEFKKDKFIAEGKDVLLPENQMGNIRTAFLNDVSNPDKCMKFIINLRKAGFDATSTAQKYLNTVAPESKISEINWKIYSNGINDFDTEEFKFLVQNKDDFAKVASASRVDKKILYTISETLKPLVDRVDTASYDKKRLIAQSYQIRKVDSLVYRFDLQLVPQTNNWKKYQKITSDNVERFSWNDATVLLDICNTYYQSVNDKKGLSQAFEWSKHLLSLGESIDKYVVASKLLMKMKDYKQAMAYVQKGKAFADGLGFKNQELNILSEEIKKHNL